ncbi:MAG: hypothetical protein NC541_11515 [bacterium]|nr:hypothetical protein [bacterium]
MKKSLAIAAVCFLAALCAVPAAFVRVNGGKDAVSITETSIYGDPREEAGITLEYDVHWEGKLLWSTEYTLGSGQTESSFSFSSNPRVWENVRREELDWYGGGAWATVSDYAVNLDGIYLSRAVKNVVERTKPGETRREEIDLADYYEYYPYSFLICSEEYDVYYNSDPLMEGDGMDPLAMQLAIPFFQEERRIVTVAKDKEGNCTMIDCKLADDPDGRETVFSEAFRENGLYLSYCFSAGDEEPSGEEAYGGVFYIPYRESDGEDRSASRYGKTLDVAACQKIWEVREGLTATDMAWDEEKEVLYFVCVGEDGCSLHVFRMKEGELYLAQTLFVTLEGEDGERAAEYWAGIRVEREGVLLTWAQGSFAFFTEEDGAYRLFCQSELSAVSPSGVREALSVFPWEYACDFDGERLVLAAYDTWQSADAWVGIYRAEGPVYLGLYEHSGSRELRANHSSDIRPWGDVNWHTPRVEQPLKIRIAR